MCPFRVLFVRSEWTAGRRAPLAARRAGPVGLQTGLRTLNCITTDVWGGLALAANTQLLRRMCAVDKKRRLVPSWIACCSTRGWRRQGTRALRKVCRGLSLPWLALPVRLPSSSCHQPQPSFSVHPSQPGWEWRRAVAPLRRMPSSSVRKVRWRSSQLPLCSTAACWTSRQHAAHTAAGAQLSSAEATPLSACATALSCPAGHALPARS